MKSQEPIILLIIVGISLFASAIRKASASRR